MGENKIFKYELPVKEKHVINLPLGAKILRVDDVEGKFYLWALVDPEAETEERHLEFYKTGQPVENSNY